MKLTACVVLLVVLALLLPEESAGWWRRRRRRSCSRVNCAWGNWGSWGACTAPCGNSGTQTRSRSVARGAQCGGAGCSGSSSDTQACNRGCPNGTPSGASCVCTGTGYTGTCCDTDINECKDGSHTCHPVHGVCTNTDGGYTCTCAEGYTGDGHRCIPINDCTANSHWERCGSACPQTCDSSPFQICPAVCVLGCVCDRGYVLHNDVCILPDDCPPEGAGTEWQQVSGRLKFVSVGRSGVWGVNSNNQIYYRTGTYGDEASAGTGWVNIAGSLKQISSGNNIVWGVNGNDDIYIRLGISWSSPSGSSWRHIPGKLKQVHVSPTSNQVWGVNSGDNIYQRTGITASNPAEPTPPPPPQQLTPMPTEKPVKEASFGDCLSSSSS
ncbi:neurogenic locus notch homolog protein 1-like [Branchiostoma floridae]|uniref:Neurogenic locus notch homolog protein 1-like n=1 Tax=Branchiostoma floridae TaxID=7739 RepID=A0A9J7LYI6_BRAFL|nr:neurogenic locus notch homolog protein 1-like [Branchiostoma floridae]